MGVEKTKKDKKETEKGRKRHKRGRKLGKQRDALCLVRHIPTALLNIQWRQNCVSFA